MPTSRSLTKVLVTGLAVTAGASMAAADCTIPETSCYPWRIDKGEESTVLLEILPNNVVTSANYRLCVCPPASGVNLTLEFDDRKVEIGKVELKGGAMICRDYRVMSSRKSRLSLSRTDGNKDVSIEGCYN